MNSDDVNLALRALAPIEDDQLTDLDLDSLEDELMLFVSARRPARSETGHKPAVGWEYGRLKPSRLTAGATALCVLVVGALWFGIGSGSSPGQPEFADAALRVAEANPRLLVTLPGWKVTRADEFEVDQGEMEFGDGSSELQLTWYPASSYETYYRDRTQVDPNPKFFSLLGKRTRTVSYSQQDFATMLLPTVQPLLSSAGTTLPMRTT